MSVVVSKIFNKTNNLSSQAIVALYYGQGHLNPADFGRDEEVSCIRHHFPTVPWVDLLCQATNSVLSYQDHTANKVLQLQNSESHTQCRVTTEANYQVVDIVETGTGTSRPSLRYIQTEAVHQICCDLNSP